MTSHISLSQCEGPIWLLYRTLLWTNLCVRLQRRVLFLYTVISSRFYWSYRCLHVRTYVQGFPPIFRNGKNDVWMGGANLRPIGIWYVNERSSTLVFITFTGRAVWGMRGRQVGAPWRRAAPPACCSDTGGGAPPSPPCNMDPIRPRTNPRYRWFYFIAELV